MDPGIQPMFPELYFFPLVRFASFYIGFLLSLLSPPNSSLISLAEVVLIALLVVQQKFQGWPQAQLGLYAYP